MTNIKSLFSQRIALQFSIVFCAVGMLLIGCSGDPRPLQEPVEAQQIDLAGLTIATDQALDGRTFISPQQTIQFTLAAINSNGQGIIVANTDRRWSVDNSDIAEISDSGLLTGKVAGEVSVGLRIGAIVANPAQVTVSTAVLNTVLIEGPDSLIECSPSDTYTATGIFGTGDDESERMLNNVEWRLSAGDSGLLLSSDPADGAIVGALIPGNVTLTATSGEISSTPRVITVSSGIESLLISPAAPVEVERSAPRPLTARATYVDAVALETQDVTSLVTWMIDQNGSDVATVSDEIGDKGILRGVRVGQTQVFASCSSQSENVAVNVVEPALIISLRIEPDDDDGPIELFDGGADVQLQVFAVSSNGSDEDVSALASWSVETGEEVVDVDNTTSFGGLLEPLTTGRATVEVSYRGVSQTVSIIVL